MTKIPLQPLGRVAYTRRIDGNVMLIKPPYFTPWTPPLGIAILKSFLERHSFSAKCFDFNVDPELWGMHHKYFSTLQKIEDAISNDGYSKLWWILNSHMLAYANGADSATCARVIETVIPEYGIRYNNKTISALLPLVEKFFRRLGELLSQIDFSDFAVVGTSTYTTSLAASLFILRTVKQQHPQLITVMGGGIFADDLALGSDNLTTLIEEYPFIDRVILGEGEIPLLNLLQGELADNKVVSIADFQGKTMEMKDVPAPDFSDLNRDGYYHLTIEGARSCPFQCSFCSETIQWGNYRKKPVGVLVDQIIELAQKYENHAFFMGDSLMNPYINPFASELIKRKANIIYDGYLRADKPVANHTFVRLWADSGLYRVRLGIESASARVLDSMNKMTSPAVISEVLKTLAKMGIRTTTYWIVGFPGETEQDFTETCDFIREHHKFIYELEAHPYYYYPYGQIGSRLYQCHSLYPDAVTEIIKFKMWDIDDVNPTREVRYDRLRRISKLASDLGLPNIYTMADRYQAEDRWHQLHPLAVEVFEKTRISRGKSSPADLQFASMAEGWHRHLTSGASGTSMTLCYRILVRKRIAEDVLAASVGQLVSYNEMLQMGLREGERAWRTKVAPGPSPGILSVDQSEGKDGQPPLDISRFVEEISAEMRPEPGASLRIALVSKEADSSELFFLAHRGIADSRSVILLCEDLFSIYEQLSYGREVSLRTAQKSFRDIVTALTDGGETNVAGSNLEILSDHLFPDMTTRDAETGGSEIIFRIDGDLGLRLTDSSLGKIELATIIVNSILQSLVNEPTWGDLVIDVLSDYRSSDIALARAVGPLNRINRLSSVPLGKADLSLVRKRLMNILSGTPIDNADDDLQIKQYRPGDRTLLVNLEYLSDSPWLGANEWRPLGFVVNESGPRAGYLAEILPVLSDQGIEFRFRHQEESSVRKAIDPMTSILPEILVSELQRCEDYAAAKQFWLSEFGKNAPESSIGTAGALGEVTTDMESSREFRVAASLIKKIEDAAGAEESVIILAAFAVLLSRVNGRQEIAIAARFDNGPGHLELPLKLHPAWSLSLKDFLQISANKVSTAAKYADSAYDILGDQSLLAQAGGACCSFDAGFVFRSYKTQGKSDAATEILPGFQPTGQPIALILTSERNNEEFYFQLAYDRNNFSQDTITKLSTYMQALLISFAENINATVGGVSLDGENRKQIATEIVAKDVFSFE